MLSAPCLLSFPSMYSVYQLFVLFVYNPVLTYLIHSTKRAPRQISLVGILFTSMQPPGTPPTNTTDLASGVAATAAADGSGTFQDL